MRKRFLALSCLLIFSLTIAGWWAATSQESDQLVRPADTAVAAFLSNQEMTTQSDFIGIGRCTDTRSEWVGRSLVTLAKISVSEVIKGEEQSSITVALPGGVDANRKFPVQMTYPGAPTIIPNEEVFLFLVSEDQVPEAYTVVGYSQGKFTIIEGEEGQKVVSRDLTKTALKRGSKMERGLRKSTDLSEFKNEVEGYLRKR